MRVINRSARLIDAGQLFAPGEPVEVLTENEKIIAGHMAEGGAFFRELVVDDGTPMPAAKPVVYSVKDLSDEDALKRIAAEKDSAALEFIVEDDGREKVVAAAKARLKKI